LKKAPLDSPKTFKKILHDPLSKVLERGMGEEF
jgi:hypothetical protein